mmetsp:Transcript_45814/g.52822  ORF Transcript_45814/g.52822 Transcript_45814/m.52822 type:complete len:842 (+) Transcript_45814:74-2599(+)|eukprot:CAMPEP_0114989780 /NCGR_PEP_ID=MMETSP0216-20121206/10392_1 /TAXON_ID=223996 /ORGANISM="Protocruzia adherens, Strain Boccale" /LENGTH=841 /DNA_ID=CAMNT_0002352805 /DNA_START=38 /DNA_END=2563 /DNA_ORIENTATION=+
MASGKRLFIIAILPVLIFLGTQLYFKLYPKVNGEVLIGQGLTSSATIKRDQWGIPHIFASNLRDVAFATGYVHAQDRLWQMDLLRRIGSGTMSEIIGKETEEVDVFMRLLNFEENDQIQYDALDDTYKAYLHSYTSGVNAAVENGATSVEHMILWADFAPWKPLDTLRVLDTLSFCLSFNGVDFLRAVFEEHFGEEIASQLLPYRDAQYEDFLTTILNEEEVKAMKIKNADLFEPYAENWKEFTKKMNFDPKKSKIDRKEFHLLPPPTASNNWGVSGKHTTSGWPVLGNDPHMSNAMPCLWHLMKFTLYDQSEVGGGAGLAGVPFFVLGRTKNVAWTGTNLTNDQMDYFVMKLNDDKTKYFHDNQWKDLKISKTSIKIRGQSEPREVEIKFSHQGVLVTEGLKGYSMIMPIDAYLGTTDDVVMAWTGLGYNMLFKAVVDGITARNGTELVKSFESIICPTMSIVWGDTQGNLGYKATGKIVVRRNPGTHFLDGTKKEADWQGYLPFSDNPEILNPEKGFIVTANNKAVPSSFPHPIHEQTWGPASRAPIISQYLSSRIAKGHKFTTTELYDLQEYGGDLLAERILSRLIEGVTAAGGLSEAEQIAFEKIKNWDRLFAFESVESGIAIAWFHELLYDILDDKLYDDQDFERFSKWYSYYEFALHWIPRWDLNQTNFYCDEIHTKDHKETCAELYRDSFQQAVTYLTEKLGSDQKEWFIGNFVHSRYKHAFSDVPVLGKLFERTHPRSGGITSPHILHTSIVTRDYASFHGANLRMVFNLDPSPRPQEDSYWMIDTGENGSVASRNYQDMMPYFRGPQRKLLPFRYMIEEHPDSILQLKPKSD